MPDIFNAGHPSMNSVILVDLVNLVNLVQHIRPPRELES